MSHAIICVARKLPGCRSHAHDPHEHDKAAMSAGPRGHAGWGKLKVERKPSVGVCVSMIVCDSA